MRLPKYATYKEWSGHETSIPTHWEVSRIKNLASINDDTLPEDSDPSLEIEYVDIGSVSLDRGIHQTQSCTFSEAPSRARRLVRVGDIIVSTVRTYLKAIAPIDEEQCHLVVSTGFAVVRAGSRLSSGFGRYALQSPGFVDEVISRSTGVSYPAINASDLARIEIPVPPAEEQVAITAFLDREIAKIDVLIVEQERLLALLSERRQAIIYKAVSQGLSPAVPRKDSGLPWLKEVPEHWEIKRLKAISPFVSVGIVVNPSAYVSDDGLPYIYGGDISEGYIDTGRCRRISPEASSAQAKTQIRKGDLLTVRVGAPGVTAVVPEDCEGGNCASVMLIRGGDFDSEWLCHAMNSRMVRYQVEVVQYGAAQEQFNIGHAVNFVIPTPPVQEQSDIANHIRSEVGGIDRLSDNCKRAISLLSERRSALISSVVTGQFDVRGVA